MFGLVRLKPRLTSLQIAAMWNSLNGPCNMLVTFRSEMSMYSSTGFDSSHMSSELWVELSFCRLWAI
jgi:hypothetical protein